MNAIQLIQELYGNIVMNSLNVCRGLEKKKRHNNKEFRFFQTKHAIPSVELPEDKISEVSQNSVKEEGL